MIIMFLIFLYHYFSPFIYNLRWQTPNLIFPLKVNSTFYKARQVGTYCVVLINRVTLT